MHAQWSVPNWFNGTQLVGAMMLEQNDEWSLNRCYMQLEGLQTL
jgi:putative transposase